MVLPAIETISIYLVYIKLPQLLSLSHSAFFCVTVWTLFLNGNLKTQQAFNFVSREIPEKVVKQEQFALIYKICKSCWNVLGLKYLKVVFTYACYLQNQKLNSFALLFESNSLKVKMADVAEKKKWVILFGFVCNVCALVYIACVRWICSNNTYSGKCG